MAELKSNHLAAEKSPYLLEHAHNPVDWYPWGEEAFARARAEQKPIFLSIGYSTCHWCHVMANESFEDEKTAKILNSMFVPIKVDREERPEIDEVYMKAVTMLTGQGGWPLSVFLTPDLKPFYGGTYFPPVPRHGLPGFPEVLTFIADTWKNRREQVVQSSDEITRLVADQYALKTEGELSKVLIDNAYAVVLGAQDASYGGFGGPPKFPLPSYLGFLLRYNARTGKGQALGPVMKTLDSMAAGGIHDHLAGGFHRYSTDRYWLVPHFEKMLYDNALLARVYSDAYRATRMERFAATSRDTLEWILAEMTSPEGGFYSAMDADTRDGEGYYYTWTPDEIAGLLGDEQAKIFDEFYGVTDEGNFEGRSILSVTTTVKKVAEKLGVAEDVVEKTLERGRAILLDARKKRNRPKVDDKVLASWNGLAISGFACAYQALQDPRYLEAAEKSAQFILSKLVKKGSSPMLSRRYRDGQVALAGNLEDYSFVVAGLLDLYEASLNFRWMSAAMMLAEEMVALFWDPAGGAFFLKPPGQEIVAIKEGYDGPTPSGNSVAALDLLRLAEFTGVEDYRQMAETTLKLFADPMESSPTAHLEMLAALDFWLGAKEIVIARGAGEADEMVKEVQTRYLPTKVLALSDGEPALARLTEGKGAIKGQPTAYVCENFACKAPASSVEALRKQLEAAPVAAGA